MKKFLKKSKFFLSFVSTALFFPSVASLLSCSNKPETAINVLILAGEGGTVSGSSNVTIGSGLVFKNISGFFKQNISCNDGYKFDKWIDADTEQPIPEDAILDKDSKIQALFKLDESSIPIINLNAIEYGHIIGEKTIQCPTGTLFKDIREIVSSHFQPYEGYILDKWVNSSLEEITDNYVITDSIQIFALAKQGQKTVTVNFSSFEHGSISGQSSFEFNAGITFAQVKEKISDEIDVRSDDGFEFDVWVDCNKLPINDNLVINLNSFDAYAFFATQADDFSYFSDEEKKTVEIYEYRGNSQDEIIIPHSFLIHPDEKYKTVTIRNSTFEKKNMKSIVIPHGIKSIGDKAFEGCNYLEKVNIPSSVESIGSAVFSDCINLNAINLPWGIKSIENKLFYNCKKLSEIKIPATVLSIGSRAFESTNITNVVIPNTVNTIGDTCFSKCPLESVTLSESITNLPSRVFEQTKLTEIKLPNFLQKIGEYCFNGCSQLKYVLMPSSLNEIGDYAFAGASNITDTSGPNNNCGFVFLNKIEKWHLVKRPKNPSWRQPSANQTKVLCSDGKCGLDDTKF